MKISTLSFCKTMPRTGITVLIAALLPGCTVSQALPEYAEATTVSELPDTAPDLVPQERFAAALDASLEGNATSIAATEALLARATQLNLWTPQQAE